MHTNTDKAVKKTGRNKGTHQSGQNDPASPDNTDSCYYLNRELTWLLFNQRVLHEAEDSRTPLLERLKFLAIVSSNLDEFFMKRIGGLKQQIGAGVRELTPDGRTPRQQVEECHAFIREFAVRKQDLFNQIRQLLAEKWIVIKSWDELSRKDQAAMRDYFFNNIFPLLTPQSIDPAHPFPFISNLSLNLLVTLHSPADSQCILARVKVPVGNGVPRFIRIDQKDQFICLEELIAQNLGRLFPGMTIVACELFRVTRNANTEKDEEKADDLVAMIESELQERKFAPIVRLEVAHGMDLVRRGRLADELELDEARDVFETPGLLAMRDLFELIKHDSVRLHDPPHHPVDHPLLQTQRNIFHTIRDAGALLLQHPYQSFVTSVERLLLEAAADPKVCAIKMTLYRTSQNGRIIDYLIRAAQNGKQVAVAVELKARFDEANNLTLAERMEEAGIHVTYGVVGLKTHCKVILVVRRDYNGLCRYVHIGTGNYHSETARLYSDLGLLTCDPAIGNDATELFNYLTTGFTPARTFEKLLPAPALLKKALIGKIEREASLHKQHGGGRIQLKMNALDDVDLIQSLYRASQAGVRIDLYVRDSCRLRVGMTGLSETIRVTSVVGRFLEHSRIYYFRNNGDEEYYIGSADAMRRNLESRVEVLAPVEPASLQLQIRSILDLHDTDTCSAWDMQPDGSYLQRRPASNGGTCQGLQQVQIRQTVKASNEGKEIRLTRKWKLKASRG
jgi:polyphosphate kinase